MPVIDLPAVPNSCPCMCVCVACAPNWCVPFGNRALDYGPKTTQLGVNLVKAGGGAATICIAWPGVQQMVQGVKCQPNFVKGLKLSHTLFRSLCSSLSFSPCFFASLLSLSAAAQSGNIAECQQASKTWLVKSVCHCWHLSSCPQRERGRERERGRASETWDWAWELRQWQQTAPKGQSFLLPRLFLGPASPVNAEATLEGMSG